jgi:hypothetical protein
MVGVVEAPEHWRRSHQQRRYTTSRRLHWLRQRLVQALMRALPIEVPSVLLEDPLQVPVSEDEQVVQALAP